MGGGRHPQHLPTPYGYGLFAAAVPTALVMLCAAAVLAVPRLTARVPRRMRVAFLAVVVGLDAACLARWALTDRFGGLLVEDMAGICGAAYVIGASVMGMRRPAARGPHCAAG
ncbi:hypothetical protein ACFYXS_22965 [Streptomyces sp. NPDC002574]|uniref:hypothetical protein n=1 Tax=Streptomyces sp. NPDC002574 TaxID=3364652 RepID=UPI00368F6D66